MRYRCKECGGHGKGIHSVTGTKGAPPKKKKKREDDYEEEDPESGEETKAAGDEEDSEAFDIREARAAAQEAAQWLAHDEKRVRKKTSRYND